MSDLCINCGKSASAYCDFHIGAPIGEYIRVGEVNQNRFHAVINTEELPYTCDVPMCGDCLTNVGNWNISGKPGYSGGDTIDHCPLHAKEKPSICEPITQDEANKIRANIRATYMRSKMKIAAAEICRAMKEGGEG